MSDLLSGKIKKISPENVSEDRYNYFKLGEVEPDLGVPLTDNGISSSLANGTRSWLYPASGLSISNNELFVDIETIQIDSNTLNYTSANNLFQAIEEIDQNSYDDIQRRLITVTTDATLIGDGTLNSPLSINANTIVDIIGESVTAEFINDLDIDAATLEGANGAFYLDWNNTANKPSPTIDLNLIGDVIGIANTTLVDLQSGIITIETTISANSVQLGVDTFGDYVESIQTGVGVSIANTGGESAVPIISIGQNVETNSNITFNNGEFTGDLTIAGNLTISGNTVSIEATSLSIEDNLIYLNANNSIANPDLGWSGNYNDGVYAHAGVFRDASDGVFKFFDSYTVEPDISPFINTGHPSFALADVAAKRFFGPVTGNVIGQVSDISNFSTSNLAEGSRLYFTTSRANTAIDLRVNKSFIDNLNVDADTLDGLDSSYYLDYGNLNNKPVIGDGVLTITSSGGISGSVTFTANQIGPSALSLINTDKGSSQNIFKTILVNGQPTITAATNSDSLEFVAGSNITLTTDPITKQITVNSTASSEDNYVETIEFDSDSGTLTLGRTGTLPDLNITIAALSANASLQFAYDLTGSEAPEGAYINLVGGGSTDQVYLKEAGATTITWDDINQTATISSVDTTYQAGAGLNLVGTTFSHNDTSSVSDLFTTPNVYISGLTFDTFGHVTSYSTDTIVDNYVDSISFDGETSTLTLGRTGALSNLSVDLTGLELTETDTLDSVVTRGNTTDKTVFVGSLYANTDIYATTFIGNLNGQVSDISNFNTDSLSEGFTNFYFTEQKVTDLITKEYVDNLDVDAATLGGLVPAYFLNYQNLINTPDSILDFGVIEGTDGDVLVTDGNGNFSFQTVGGAQGEIGYTGSRGGQGEIGYTGSRGDPGLITETADDAPLNPVDGQMWFNTTDGTLNVYYEDGDSGQWVVTSGPPGIGGPVGPIGLGGPLGFTGSKGSVGVVTETSDVAPVGPEDGQMWFNTNDGTLNVYYEDGDSGQWVVTSGPPGIGGPVGPIGFIGSKGFTGSKGDLGIIAETTDDAPLGPLNGQMWFNTTDGTLNVYYEDGDSGQWIVTSGPSGLTGFDGSKGNIGFTGSFGFTGSKGDIGYTGSQGDIGFTGSSGAYAAVGFTGSQGDVSQEVSIAYAIVLGG